MSDVSWSYLFAKLPVCDVVRTVFLGWPFLAVNQGLARKKSGILMFVYDDMARIWGGGFPRALAGWKYEAQQT